MRRKILVTLIWAITISFGLDAQIYQLDRDTDSDGIMNADDQDSLDRNIPFDSVFNYTYCIGEEAKIDLEILFPGLVMIWDSSTDFKGYTGYGRPFVPKNNSKYYSTLYDTTYQMVIRRLEHKMNVGNEHLQLKIDKVEKKSFRRQKGVSVIMNRGFDYYDWSFNGNWHDQTVMNIGRFYDDGRIEVIGEDKYGCKDTLQFEIKIADYYPATQNVDEPQFGYFKPKFQKFSDIESARGIVDIKELSGIFDGPYIYYISELPTGPESSFRDDFMRIQLDKSSNRGTWVEEKNAYNFELNSTENQIKINVNRKDKIKRGEIIKLDRTILRIIVGNNENQRIEEYYRAN